MKLKLQNHPKTFVRATGLTPYAAPSTEGFGRISPQGSGRDAARFRRAMDSPSENPVQTLRSAGYKRHGVAFSLDIFFWPSKRKYRGCRAETRL
ncbi:hypothetical protein J0667_19755 [Methylomonas sp. WH-1]|uniref:hypothetical protein n=1 Tax=unclassified Methylomonas TaxID=2608980 RepID=UPI0013EE6BF5|nr:MULTISPECIES: hypothetical protein [unclassified Methylomonas]